MTFCGWKILTKRKKRDTKSRSEDDDLDLKSAVTTPQSPPFLPSKTCRNNSTPNDTPNKLERTTDPPDAVKSDEIVVPQPEEDAEIVLAQGNFRIIKAGDIRLSFAGRRGRFYSNAVRSMTWHHHY